MQKRMALAVAALLVFSLGMQAQDQSDQTVQKKHHGKSSAGEYGNAAGDAGKGGAGAVGNSAKGAGQIATLHPVAGTKSIGKGGEDAGKGAAKGTGKVVKGTGKIVTHPF